MVVAVIALWALIAAVLCGVGNVALRLAGQGRQPWTFAHLWVGLSAVVAALQLAHFVVPVDARAQLCVAAVGVAGLLLGQRPRLALGTWRSAIVGATTLGLALLAARHALILPRAYDTGTYHLPAVTWLSSYPIVPGLANLHVRFGFNVSVFLYDALLNVGWLHGMAVHLSLGVFVVVAGMELVTTAVDPRAPLSMRVACGLALPALIGVLLGQAFEGLSPDVVLYCLALHIARRMLAASLASEPERADARAPVTTLWLCAAGCTFKLSFLVFAVLAAAWTIWTAGRSRSRRPWFTVGIASGVTVASWLVRSVVLTGYPLFPSGLMPFPVAWRVPLSTALQKEMWTRAWARRVDDYTMTVPAERSFQDWSWLRPWLAHLPANAWDVLYPLVLFVGASVGIAVLWRRCDDGRHRRLLLAMAVTIAALGWWFILAPDVRFAGSLFVVLAMFGVALLIETAPASSVGPMAIAVALVAAAGTAKQVDSAAKWWRAWPPMVGLRSVPAPSVGMVATASGLRVVVPLGTETCWASPLPCSPYPAASLSLRDPGHLSSGFMASPFSEDLLVGWWSAAHQWQEMQPARTPGSP